MIKSGSDSFSFVPITGLNFNAYKSTSKSSSRSLAYARSFTYKTKSLTSMERTSLFSQPKVIVPIVKTKKVRIPQAPKKVHVYEPADATIKTPKRRLKQTLLEITPKVQYVKHVTFSEVVSIKVITPRKQNELF